MARGDEETESATLNVLPWVGYLSRYFVWHRLQLFASV